MTATCTHCAEPLRPGAHFCPLCGSPAPPMHSQAPPVDFPEQPAADPRTSGQSAPGRPPSTRRLLVRLGLPAVAVGIAVTAAIIYTQSHHGRKPTSGAQLSTNQPSSSQSLATSALSESSASTPTLSATTAQPPGQNAQPNPAAVVASYYAAVNAHDWTRAWQLGGKNFGQSYDAFVAGYAHTVRTIVTDSDLVDNTASQTTVSVHLLAQDDDGTVQLFGGTDTVDSGTITSGNLTQQLDQSAAAFEATPLQSQLALFGYDLEPAPTNELTAGLQVILGTCTGSADGRCEKAFFYYGHTLVGVDTAEPDLAVTIAWERTALVALQYPQFRQQDPMCCPSGNTVTIQFAWDGHVVSPTSPLPSPINGI
jgi:LppP/LprE lipoprotein/zinc ribbon protein